MQWALASRRPKPLTAARCTEVLRSFDRYCQHTTNTRLLSTAVEVLTPICMAPPHSAHFFLVANLVPPEGTGQDRRKSRYSLMPVSRRARSHLSCLRQRSSGMSGSQHVRTVTIPLTIRLFSREKRTCQTVARRLLYTQYTVALRPDL